MKDLFAILAKLIIGLGVERMSKEGFIDIEQLSPPTKKGMGKHRAIAYSGTRKNPTGILGFRDYRTGSGAKKALKFLEGLLK